MRLYIFYLIYFWIFVSILISHTSFKQMMQDYYFKNLNSIDKLLVLKLTFCTNIFIYIIIKNSYYFIFKVLELRSGATQTEIKNQCRTLAVKYHPDKAKDDITKKDVQNRFFEVQQACELLSNSRAKRRRRNKQFNEEL